MRRDKVLRILARFRDLKRDEFGIVRIGVFGSVARDEMVDASDVDVVVEVARPDLLTLVGIKQELKELLRLPVDVVAVPGANESLPQGTNQTGSNLCLMSS